MPSRKQVEWLVLALFLGVVALVFQQIATSMTEQGIASGGPYDNAAAYPRIVAILLLVLAAGQAAVLIWRRSEEAVAVPWARLGRPAAMLVIFGAYLGVLRVAGYHLATPVMLAAIMVICGLRRPAGIVVPALAISLGLAWLFEGGLNIVLPGGVFGLNMPW